LDRCHEDEDEDEAGDEDARSKIDPSRIKPRVKEAVISIMFVFLSIVRCLSYD
jgi:hypothetical protein